MCACLAADACEDDNAPSYRNTPACGVIPSLYRCCYHFTSSRFLRLIIMCSHVVCSGGHRAHTLGHQGAPGDAEQQRSGCVTSSRGVAARGPAWIRSVDPALGVSYVLSTALASTPCLLRPAAPFQCRPRRHLLLLPVFATPQNVLTHATHSFICSRMCRRGRGQGGRDAEPPDCAAVLLPVDHRLRLRDPPTGALRTRWPESADSAFAIMALHAQRSRSHPITPHRIVSLHITSKPDHIPIDSFALPCPSLRVPLPFYCSCGSWPRACPSTGRGSHPPWKSSPRSPTTS